MSSLITAVILAAGGIGAAGFVLAPLWHRGKATAAATEDAALRAQRARLRELEDELVGGTIDREAYRVARRETERDLLTAAGARSPAFRQAGQGNLTLGLLGIAVAVFAIFLYLDNGRPDLLLAAPAKPGPVAGTTPTAADIVEQLPVLEAHLADQPTDVTGWTILARAHLALDQTASAAEAMARAIEANGEIPELLILRAHALALQQDGHFNAEAIDLIERVLTRAPEHPDALFLGGVAAAQAGDWARARVLWTSLRAGVDDPELAARIDAALDGIPE